MMLRKGAIGTLLVLLLISGQQWLLTVAAQELSWVRQFWYDRYSHIAGVATDSDRNAYLAGYEEAPDGSWLRKYRPDGSLAWSTNVETPAPGSSYGGIYGDIHDVTADDSGVYVVGQISWVPDNGFSFRSTGFIQRRSLANGDQIWGAVTHVQPTLAGPYEESASSVATDGQGRVYLAGNADRPDGRGLLVVAYSEEFGGELWTRIFVRPQGGGGETILADESGVYIVGTNDGTSPGQTSPPGSMVFVRKLDADGAELWGREVDIIPGQETDSALGASGDLSILGGGNVTTLSPDGTVIRTVPIDGKALAVDQDDNILITRRVTDSTGNGDVEVAAYNSGGAPLWTRQFGSEPYGEFPPDDDPTWITSDRLGGAYVAGIVVGAFPGEQPGRNRPDVFIARIRSDEPEPPPTTPTPHPSGRIALMANWLRGEYRIFVMNGDGSQPMQIGPGNEPAWSPDAQRIAYNASGVIVLIRPDGTDHVELTRGIQPAWSPDGTRIAFSDGTSIFTINIDGTNRTRVTDGTSPAWSPDGRKIAYTHNWDIVVANADGSNPVRVTTDDADDDAPSWSPDGTTLAFHSGAVRFEYDIYVINVDGTGRRRLTESTGNARSETPAWSPGGSRIIFTHRSETTSHTNLYTIKIDGTDIQRLTTGVGNNNYVQNPDWVGSGHVVPTATATQTQPPVPTQSVDSSVRQVSASGEYLATDPRAPAGVYRITFGFQNTSTQAFTDLQARITDLTGGHSIVNRDGAPTSVPAGVGAILTLTDASLGPDGNLAPNETFTQVIEVGLQRREGFRIEFTGTGAPANALAARSSGPEAGPRRSAAAVLTGSGEFSPDATPATTTPTGTPSASVVPSATVIPSATVMTPTATQISGTSTGVGPAACAPRPKIAVRTASAGDGRIEATISTEATVGVPNNALTSVRVTGLSNATVQVVGGPALASGAEFTPPAGAREVRLLVSRERPGPMTAHLEIEDGCGRHTTFVGAGAGVR